MPDTMYAAAPRTKGDRPFYAQWQPGDTSGSALHLSKTRDKIDLGQTPSQRYVWAIHAPYSEHHLPPEQCQLDDTDSCALIGRVLLNRTCPEADDSEPLLAKDLSERWSGVFAPGHATVHPARRPMGRPAILIIDGKPYYAAMRDPAHPEETAYVFTGASYIEKHISSEELDATDLAEGETSWPWNIRSKWHAHPDFAGTDLGVAIDIEVELDSIEWPTLVVVDGMDDAFKHELCTNPRVPDTVKRAVIKAIGYNPDTDGKAVTHSQNEHERNIRFPIERYVPHVTSTENSKTHPNEKLGDANTPSATISLTGFAADGNNCPRAGVLTRKSEEEVHQARPDVASDHANLGRAVDLHSPLVLERLSIDYHRDTWASLQQTETVPLERSCSEIMTVCPTTGRVSSRAIGGDRQCDLDSAGCVALLFNSSIENVGVAAELFDHIVSNVVFRAYNPSQVSLFASRLRDRHDRGYQTKGIRLCIAVFRDQDSHDWSHLDDWEFSEFDHGEPTGVHFYDDHLSPSCAFELIIEALEFLPSDVEVVFDFHHSWRQYILVRYRLNPMRTSAQGVRRKFGIILHSDTWSRMPDPEWHMGLLVASVTGVHPRVLMRRISQDTALEWAMHGDTGHYDDECSTLSGWDNG